MIGDGDLGLAFERGEIVPADDARNRDQLTTACAEEMVVVRLRQLEPGAPILELDLARCAVGHQLLGGAEDGGEVRAHAARGQPGLEVFERPGMVVTSFHQAPHRGGDQRFSRHSGKIADGGLIAQAVCAIDLRYYIFAVIWIAGSQVPSTATTARIASPSACSTTTERHSVRSGSVAVAACCKDGNSRKRLTSARPTIAAKSATLTISNLP